MNKVMVLSLSFADQLTCPLDLFDRKHDLVTMKDEEFSLALPLSLPISRFISVL
jgi:hypothetical protein